MHLAGEVFDAFAQLLGHFREAGVLLQQFQQPGVGVVVVGALLQAGLVDELIVYIAPKLLGNAARGLCALPGLEELSQAPHFKFNEIRQVGPDVCLHLTTA